MEQKQSVPSPEGEQQLLQAELRAVETLMAAGEMRMERGWNYLAAGRFTFAATIYLELADTQEDSLFEMKAGRALMKAAHAYMDAGTSYDSFNAEKTFREAREHFNAVSSNIGIDPDSAAEATKLAAEAAKLAREAYLKGLGSD